MTTTQVVDGIKYDMWPLATTITEIFDVQVKRNPMGGAVNPADAFTGDATEVRWAIEALHAAVETLISDAKSLEVEAVALVEAARVSGTDDLIGHPDYMTAQSLWHEAMQLRSQAKPQATLGG